MTLDVRLVGNAMQLAVCTLSPGQTMYCEAGKFLFKSADVRMETRITAPSRGGAGGGGGPAGPAGGGLGGLLGGGGAGGGAGAMGGLLRGAMTAGKRMLAGESVAFQYFSTPGGDGLVAFAGVLPGEMRTIEMTPGRTWYAEKDAFVAAEDTVEFDISFVGGRAGLSGGEGFVLEKFGGTGTLIIAGAGNFIELNPAEYGGRIQVDTGCVVAFEDTVSYGVERVGKLDRAGLMNMMFGGEGLSLATLTGDGLVILQSTTIEALAKALAKNMGAGDNKGAGGLGGLFSGSAD